ncbi:uncharacterized protein BT62DRAFT_921993 [Guyanagaster necrorhizus]|uniref:Uncharacterized protein n=1 Tax=Guyanagaster necrorhizus TaxID=856835 RepID=A0A9P7VPB8_9AGAR|nr:uncharacterized protein BT62DRAFT_921993 [Guyanagaster necrorhizus MCA 3950]KAG7443534.1 hypothetical protein BT62DRAFT_921993 [Guyanagaster necrorhizus MCA 3950]
MPRIVQKSCTLFAAIFASYSDLFDEEAWQQQFGFPGFDVDHISNVKNEELSAVHEFLKHIRNLPLDEAITYWSKSCMVLKLRIMHNHAILHASINIKAMYWVAAKKENAKFIMLMMFGSKEAEIAESMFGRAFEDNESGCIEHQCKNHCQAETCRLEVKGELDAMWKLFESGNGQINLKDAKKISNTLKKYEKYIGWEAIEQDKAALAEYEQRKGEFEQVLLKAEAQEEELKKNKKSSEYILGHMMNRRIAVMATEEEIAALHEDLASWLKSIESTCNREEAEQYDIDINLSLPSHPDLIEWEK